MRKSFTSRSERMSRGHHAAYERLGPQLVLDVPRAAVVTTIDPAHRLDVVELFGREAPLIVEIGSGSGDAVRYGAGARPDWDFLAFEVWRPGVGQALARMGAHPPSNIRFVEADAGASLGTLLPPGSVHEVWTFFPDPWPKRKHHKRRLVAPDFADQVWRVLQPEGIWRLATDWADYADVMADLLDADRRFEPAGTGRAPLRPVTRFEQKGIDAGRVIHDLAYRRRA